MGSVPLQAGGEAAADELEYCVKSLGLKGVEVLAHVRDKELSDPTFEPFWAKVEATGRRGVHSSELLSATATVSASITSAT